MLGMTKTVWLEILAEAWRVYPEEACGLVLGHAGSPGPDGGGTRVVAFEPVTNAAASSRIFELDPRGFMRAERRADDEGLTVVGVVHSHTHTAAYPSPTDVVEATKPLVPPSWSWIIVSLEHGFPEVRSFSVAPSGPTFRRLPGRVPETEVIRSGIAEEPVTLSR